MVKKSIIPGFESMAAFGRSVGIHASTVENHMKEGKCLISRHSPVHKLKLPETHPLKSVWQNMRDRCYNSKNPRYKNYGGRGIKVCGRWFYSFDNFVEDMGPKPTPEHSLDRIDVNGNYGPDNCRWADSYTQSMNRTNSSPHPHIMMLIQIETPEGKTHRKTFRTLEKAERYRDELLVSWGREPHKYGKETNNE